MPLKFFILLLVLVGATSSIPSGVGSLSGLTSLSLSILEISFEQEKSENFFSELEFSGTFLELISFSGLAQNLLKVRDRKLGAIICNVPNLP